MIWNWFRGVTATFTFGGITMKTLTIDRLEGIYAICVDSNAKFFAIETSELPKGAAAGDVIAVDEEAGTLTIDEEETAKRKNAKKK